MVARSPLGAPPPWTNQRIVLYHGSVAMIGLQARDEFWSVVEECLQQFHHLSAADAVQKSRELRRKLKSPPAGLPTELASDLIYHDDPFEVACDLAGRQLDPARYRTQYEAILSRHSW